MEKFNDNVKDSLQKTNHSTKGTSKAFTGRKRGGGYYTAFPTAACIRRHIKQLAHNQIFSIRDFLMHGSRNAVDQAFYKLVKSGYITRITRGLYMKDSTVKPTIAEVACAKAKAFGKRIVTDGAVAACHLNLKTTAKHKNVFAINGSTSCFRYGNEIIRFKSTCARKMQLADRRVGLAIRALWDIGKLGVAPETFTSANFLFNRLDREMLRQAATLMPSWMREGFDSFGTMNCVKAEPSLLTP